MIMAAQTVQREMTVAEYLERLDEKSFRDYTKVNMSKDKLEIYKTHLERYELETHLAAGDCAVDIIGKIVKDSDVGVIMPVEHALTRVEASHWTAEKRAAVSRELIALLQRLHQEKHIVFGDLKPANFLWCHDREYRFCDFGEARIMDWDRETFKHTKQTCQYVSPKRWDDPYHRPTVDDDWYSMALTIWSLYTGRLPPPILSRTADELENLEVYKPIDIQDIVDDDIRIKVQTWLVNGGAGY